MVILLSVSYGSMGLSESLTHVVTVKDPAVWVESGGVVPSTPVPRHEVVEYPDREVRGRNASLYGPLEPMNILYEVSSSDRGQRIQMSAQYGGTFDKLDTMCAEAREAARMCEMGHNVTFAVTAAWSVSEEEATLREALRCRRAEIPLLFRDHFRFNNCSHIRNCPGLLASRHRLWLAELLEEPTAYGTPIDFVIHTEDDVLLTVEHVHAYLEHLQRLAAAGIDETTGFFPGFLRYEVNKTAPLDNHFVWEPSRGQDAWRVVRLATDGTPYIDFGSGIPAHQACWMATRAQIAEWDTRCRHGFVNIKESPPPTWVEFWSGFLQMFTGDCTNGGQVHKLVPLLDLERFTVHHMANNKLSVRRMDLVRLMRTTGELKDIAMRQTGGVDDWKTIGSAP